MAAEGIKGGSACIDTTAVQQLAQVLNSRDDGFHCLGVALSGGDIKAIVFETHPSSREVASGGPTTRTREFPVPLIESGSGAVLEGTPGHDAVILQGRFARPATSAELVIRYLYNGITGEYRQCAVGIGKTTDGKWHLLDQRHRNVERIVVRTREVPLLGTVGIANLEGACGTA